MIGLTNKQTEITTIDSVNWTRKWNENDQNNNMLSGNIYLFVQSLHLILYFCFVLYDTSKYK